MHKIAFYFELRSNKIVRPTKGRTVTVRSAKCHSLQLTSCVSVFISGTKLASIYQKSVNLYSRGLYIHKCFWNFRTISKQYVNIWSEIFGSETHISRSLIRSLNEHFRSSQMFITKADIRLG